MRNWRTAWKATWVPSLGTAAVLLIGAGDAGHAQGKEFGLTGDSEVLALLRQARSQLGEHAQLASVKSLQVEGVQIRGERGTDRTKFRHSILFPDSYRSDSDIVTTVLTKHHYWREFHQAVPFWNPTTAEEKDVRRRTLLGFVESCLVTLLRAPEHVVVRAKSHGRRTVGGLAGDVVEFDVVGAGTLEFVFHSTTRRPIGFVSGGRPAGDPGQRVLRVERFLRYEAVAAIQVPVESEQLFVGGTASGKPQRIERKVTVNPPIQPRSFQQPSKR